MDELRPEEDRVYGPPRITVVPRREDGDALPTLHASRATDHALGFHVLKPADKWYPGSAIERPQPLTWRAQRKHKRWLRSSHPQVIAGIDPDLLSDLLDQDTGGPGAGRRSLLAVGQMTDVSLAKSRRPRALLASAAGASGELLRLTALRRTRWHWGPHDGDGDPALRLLDTDAGSLEDVVLWSQDDSPITQIKVALNLADQDAPSRYVMVQKKRGTTVLKPRYHRLPVTGQAPRPDGGSTERPSRIEPRPVLTILHTHTGGPAHSDVAYSPGSAGRPERLGIVDEHGFWTVWDLQGKIRLGSHDYFPRLRYCGHIRDGVLEGVPEAAETESAAGFHGILWVGPARGDWSHWDAALDALDDPRSAVSSIPHRSRNMLVWSRTSLALVDLRRRTSHDHGRHLLRTRGDRILDVQLSPANQGHAVVLTSTNLFWVDLLASSESTPLCILMSCAHMRSGDRDSLALTVNHGWHHLGDDACMASVYASTSRLLDVFIFSATADGALPQFQHHQIRIPYAEGAEACAPPNIRSLCLAPALLDVMTPADPGSSRSPLPPPQGPGAQSMKREDRFWQLFVFDEALGLQASLVAATPGDGADLRPPDKNPELSDRRQWQIQRQRRADVIRHLAETFVIPDAFVDADNIVLQTRKARPAWQTLLPEEADVAPPRWPRHGAEGVSRLAMQVGGSIESVALEVERLRGSADGQAPSRFDRLHRALVSCLSDDEERRALKTLREYDPSFEAPPFDEATEGSWDMQLGELLDVSDQRVVVDAVLPSFLGLEINSSTTIAAMRRHLQGLWGGPEDLAPAARQSRDLAIAEAAEAALSSLYAVAVFDADTARHFDGLRSWVPDPEAPLERDELAASQQRSPYLTPRQSQSPSRPSSSQQMPSSQPSRSPSQEPGACPALQRLSMLAARLDASRRAPGRAHDVLAFWPEQRGVPTAGYQSSVEVSSTQRVAQIRKAQRSDSRRRAKRTRITSMPSSSAAVDPAAAAFSSQGLPPLLRTEQRPAILVAPPPMFASDGPAVGGGGGGSLTARRLIKQDYAMSSQAPASSQSQGMGLGLGVMSQPVPGQHGKRPRPTKKKRKGGF